MTSLIGSWKIAEFGSGDDQAAFMIGPSMTTSALMYFHSATSSLRASATIFASLRRRPFCLTRSSNHKERPSAAGGAATSRRARPLSFAAADCRLSRRPGRDQPRRAGELTAVWVPDRGHQAMRDLVRAREAAQEAQKRASAASVVPTSTWPHPFGPLILVAGAYTVDIGSEVRTCHWDDCPRGRWMR